MPKILISSCMDCFSQSVIQMQFRKMQYQKKGNQLPLAEESGMQELGVSELNIYWKSNNFASPLSQLC